MVPSVYSANLERLIWYQPLPLGIGVYHFHIDLCLDFSEDK